MRRLESAEIKSILFVSLNNIGDVVLTLPSFRVVEAYFKHAKIDVIVGKNAKCVFEHESRIHRIIVPENKSLSYRWKLFLEMKRKNYDLVIDLKKTVFSLLGRHKTPWFGSSRTRHKRDKHIDHIKNWGIPDELFQKAFPEEVPRFGKLKEKYMIPSSSYIVIAPGSKSHIKEWGGESFASLADRLIGHFELPVFWIGGTEDKLKIDNIQVSMQNKSVNLAGQLNWNESSAVVANAKLLITNDSAPLHIADHYGVKVLSLFGPTDPSKYGPQNTKEGVVNKGKFCSPCEKAQCRFDLECLRDITVDQVFKRAKHLMDDIPEKKGPQILVVRLDRIGDVMLSFPAFRAIRNKFPNANIVVMTRPQCAPLVERSEDVDEVISYDYGKGGRHRYLWDYFRLLKEVKSRKFEVAFILHPTFRSHLFCALALIPYRVGYKMGWLHGLTHAIADKRHEGHQHESDNTFDVIHQFKIPFIPKKIHLSIYNADEHDVKVLLLKEGLAAGEGYMVFHPESSSVSKCWPREYFVELGKMLYERWGYRICIVGHSTPDSKYICHSLGSIAIDLMDKTHLIQLAALLKHSQLFVSNDSGPVHIAAGVNAKCISIFGRNQPGLSAKRWRPLGSNSRYLQKDVGCVTCLADKCTISFECLKALLPQDVFDEANSLLMISESKPTVHV